MVAPPANVELIRQWEEYLRNLDAEANRANEILKILDKGVKGLIIPAPPVIDFEAMASGQTKINVTKASPDARAQWGQWNKEILTVLEAANQYAPLLTTSELQMVIANKLKRQLTTKERNSISNSAGVLAKDGKIGKIEDPVTGRYVHGDLKYFDNGNTMKPKYRHLLGATTIQPVEFLPREPEAAPKPTGPIELSEKDLANWSWSKGILDLLEEYDSTHDGLLSSTQIIEKLTAKYSNLKIDKKVSSLVPSHLSLLFKNGKIGRIQVEVPRPERGGLNHLLVYGHTRYFDRNGSYYDSVKPEHDYLAIHDGNSRTK